MPLKKKKAAKKAVKKKLVKKAVKKRKVTAKKVIKRKPAKKPAKKPVAVKPEGKVIGSITHYFPHVQAAVIKLKAPLATGDTIKIKGHTTDFNQTISSMQIDHVTITNGKKGDEIGLLVNSRVRQHDVVYKI